MYDVVIVGGSYAGLAAAIVAEWGMPGETTLFLNEGASPQAAEMAELASRGIRVETEGVLEARDGANGMELLVKGGRRYDLAGLFVLPRTRLPGRFAAQLGCQIETGPTGSMYKTDARTKRRPSQVSSRVATQRLL